MEITRRELGLNNFQSIEKIDNKSFYILDKISFLLNPVEILKEKNNITLSLKN